MMACAIEHELDHKEQLRHEDLVGLLLEYCNEKITRNLDSQRSEIHELIKEERQLTQQEIILVINGYQAGLSDVKNTINAFIKSQGDRLSDLELKVHTVNRYFSILNT